MARLNEEERWEEIVDQIENGEPVDGGDDGPVVKMVRAVANRTLWLKRQLKEAGETIQNLNNTITTLDLSWLKIIDKPAKYPPEDHYHNGLCPVGAIIGWTKATAPDKGEWAICNGENGTPDLRDRFIVGAGSTYRVGDKGGASTVTLNQTQLPSFSLSITLPKLHGQSGKYANLGWSDGDTSSSSWQGNTVWTSSVGSNQPHENKPPYYALYYIMRIN